MATKDIPTTIDKIIARIYTLETYTIPEYEEELAYLESPEYEPDDNPSPRDREDDIEWLTWELRSHQGDLFALQERLNELLREDRQKAARERSTH